MDRNTLIGFILIGIVLITYQYLTLPTKEQLEQQQKTEVIAKKDSINTSTAAANTNTNTNAPISGVFIQDSTSTEQFTTLENNVFKITFSNKGGRIYSTELKKYTTFENKPVVLSSGNENNFEYQFYLKNSPVYTQQYYYTVSQPSPKSISYKLHIDADTYLEHTFKLPNDDEYFVDHSFNLVNANDVLLGTQPIKLNWQQNLLQQEKDLKSEQMATTVYFKEKNEDATYLSETSDAQKDLSFNIEWVGFKQHFFNQTVRALNNFNSGKVAIKLPPTTDSSSVEHASAELNFEYVPSNNFSFPMSIYLGPNNYKQLASYNLGYEKMIPLGWGIFGWINKYVVIPIFNFLNQFIGNYGIIILLLTLLIRAVLFPLNYRSFLSFAKMNVLKPEIEEIKAQYPDDAQRVQMETMKLYSKAGVNPLGGCLPQLLQLPFLIAMYRFFPASLELRHQPFLWANDLSTYDSILTLPFKIPAYGDHVSLFCLLSAVSTYLYTKLNNQMTPSGSPEMQLQMKIMQVIMPFMLLFFFNNVSSGLSYYFFLSNIIGFAQQWIIKKFFIDEKKLHEQIQANKNKPASTSKFQERLQNAMKMQEEIKKTQEQKKGKK